MLDKDNLLHEKLHFWKNGYVVVRNMFTQFEMAIVKQKVQEIDEMNAVVNKVRILQENGEHPSFETIFVWNDVDGDDLFAKVGKSYKILDRLSYFYDDDVYDYHNKIVLKYPNIVGFRAHQDYAYWKGYGCQFPEAHAAFIAIDKATEENGCIKVMEGSHFLGTLPHEAWSGRGSDNGVKQSILQNLLDIGYDLKPIELDPGDVLLFHGNTIHGSDDNNSGLSRISMVATMNTKRNSPIPEFNSAGHPYWTHQKRIQDPITEDDLKLPLPDFNKKFTGFSNREYNQ